MTGNVDTSWLWDSEFKAEESDVKFGGDFGAASFAGQWTCTTMYKITADPGTNLRELQIESDGHQSAPFGEMFYFKPSRQDEAKKVQKMLGLEYSPQLVWHWETPTPSVINWGNEDKSIEEVFGGMITQDISTVGWGAKSRHQFHLMVLPSVIQSIAVSSNMIKPVYDYYGLGDKITEGYGYDEQNHLIGDPEEKDAEGEFHFTKSELFQARAKLWLALGEENPLAYTIDGNGKFNIESRNLAALASILYRPSTTIWSNWVRVFDPRADAFSKTSGNRRFLYLCTNVWRTREEAISAVGESSSANTDGEPTVPVPTMWASAGASDWIDYAKTFLSDNGLLGKPSAVIKKSLQKLADENGEIESAAATVDDILKIAEYLANS